MTAPAPLVISTNTHRPDAVSHLLDLLPNWFALPDSNRQYAQAARTLRNYLAHSPGTPDPVGIPPVVKGVGGGGDHRG